MPRSDRELRTAYVVGRLDRSLRRAIEHRLRELSVTLSQVLTLSVIARREGLSNAQLARRALVTPQAMQQVLAALAEKGLIARESDPAHQGILRTTLTPAGKALLEKAEAAIAQVEAEMLAGIPAERRAEFTEFLIAAVAALGGGLAEEPRHTGEDQVP